MSPRPRIAHLTVADRPGVDPAATATVRIALGLLDQPVPSHRRGRDEESLYQWVLDQALPTDGLRVYPLPSRVAAQQAASSITGQVAA